MKVDKVEYELDAGKITSSAPIALAEQVLTNNSDHDQEMSFNVNKIVTHSSTFEYSTGFTITFGMEFNDWWKSILSYNMRHSFLNHISCSLYPSDL